jgi:hypothetical protein
METRTKEMQTHEAQANPGDVVGARHNILG